MDENLLNVVKQVSSLCKKQGWVLTTAESCTGGWVATLLTELPGSSAWFDCGFITYSNQAKMNLLGVSVKCLNKYGAVSREVVKEMADGALLKAQANFSLAVSGIAGPDGGSDAKPVGTVWIAWQHKDGASTQAQFCFKGTRYFVRKQAVLQALIGIMNFQNIKRKRDE